MISSMTGYGRGKGTGEGFSFSAELRSVNHRYADFSIRLPRELYFIEDRIRKLLQESIRRGRVEASVAIDEVPVTFRRVNINLDLASEYNSALNELSERLGLIGEVKLEHLLQMPELFKTEHLSLPVEQVWPPVEMALNEALEGLLAQRQREGENLCRDLTNRCDAVLEMVRTATGRAAEAQNEYREKMEQKFKELLAGEFEENRLIMECALMVDRMGVDEELVRLESHVSAFRDILTGSDPAGRKLDFIAQEMFREVNTIGSKAADYKLTSLVVEMKVELEKIREQLQNLE